MGPNSLLGPGPTETGQLIAPHTHTYLHLAEIHLQLGSVILVFSTLGISRSCAAILAFLIHWNEQTLKVCIPQARVRLQLRAVDRVRPGPGRKGAPTGGGGWEEKGLEREL